MIETDKEAPPEILDQAPEILAQWLVREYKKRHHLDDGFCVPRDGRKTPGTGALRDRVEAESPRRNEDSEACGCYSVEFALSESLCDSKEPFQFVTEITGKILCEFFDGFSRGYREEAGRLRARLVQVARAREEKQSVFEVFDSVDGELSEYYEALFDHGTEDFKSSLSEELKIVGSNVLILERVEVLPPHRAKDLGLASILKAIHLFGGGAGVVAIKPFPLQISSVENPDSVWCRKMEMDSLSKNESVARRKLENYWARLGFKRVRATKIFARSSVLQSPKLVSVGRDGY